MSADQNTMHYEYAVQNRLTAITDAEQRRWVIEYGDFDEVRSVLDNDKIGFKFKFDYDKSKDEYYTMVE